MKIFYWNDLQNQKDDFFSATKSGISIGSFDGLHKGHRVLLKTLVENCSKNKWKSGVVTFERPLPSIKHSSDYSGDISTLSQRLFLFESLGIDFVIIADFTEDFASLKGVDFLSLLVKQCNMAFLAEGVDFRCGYKGATDTSAIKYWASQNKVQCQFVNPVFYMEGTDQEERISSSFIRQMVQKSFFTTVCQLLERPYEIDLETIKKVGKCNQVLPADGVYSVKDEKGDICRLKIQNGKIAKAPESKKIVFY